MTKAKAIALVFSDLHLNLWSKFNQDNQRTLEGFRVLLVLSEKAKALKVPILFCGDLFHKPESMDQELLNIYYQETSKLPKEVEWYGIDGNHDEKKICTYQNQTPGWLKLIGNNLFKSLNFDSVNLTKDITVYGIPYLDGDRGMSEYISSLKLNSKVKNILLLHTTYPGSRDTDGREVEASTNLNINLLNKFDLVLCGHIHKPHRLSKKVYMVGAPIQQRRTDMNCKMGYWIVYSDMSMKFCELKGFPKFIDVENELDIKDDGNYYTLLPQKTSESSQINHKITKRLSKKSLARKYLREKGISDKDKKELLIDILKRSDND
jgi:DNA repair exonuclease SbcCD nuclease subunit